MEYVLRMHPTNRLRELRKRAGLRQHELAERSGVSQSAISQYENDARPLTLDHMRTFARILKCATADFLVDEDNPGRLTAEEMEIVRRYRAADERGRDFLARTAEATLPFRAPPKADNAA